MLRLLQFFLILKLQLKAQLWYVMKKFRYQCKFYNIETALNRERIFGETQTKLTFYVL